MGHVLSKSGFFDFTETSPIRAKSQGYARLQIGERKARVDNLRAVIGTGGKN